MTLKALSDKSGHYMPGLKYTRQGVGALEQNGIDMSDVQYDFIGH
jgi:hypothetical protein